MLLMECQMQQSEGSLGCFNTQLLERGQLDILNSDRQLDLPAYQVII
jgi:hypothetical protein